MRNLNSAFYLLVGLVLLVSTGCQDMYLADDIDLVFDFDPLDGASDTLHSPYVLGTEVTIFADDALHDDDEEDSWQLESSDESVLRIDSAGGGYIRCTAVGVGSADISVYDDNGERVHTGTVEVRAPTRAEIYAHGPLLIGRSDEEARIDGTVHVLQGGLASFLVRYFDGNQRLYGNGVLTAESVGTDQIDLFEETTYVFENREWLQMRPIIANTFSVELFAGEIPVAELTVEGVTPAEVDHVDLQGETERGADEEDNLCVLAQAYDGDGNPVYGAEFIWEVDGLEQTQMGDLYMYDYDPDESVDLTADFQGMVASIDIHSSGGHVSSTNNLGCSATGRPAALPEIAVFLGFVVVGVVLARRRR